MTQAKSVKRANKTPEPHHEMVNFDNREHQILSVARDLFTMKGYDGTSIRDIADAISIKTASIYYYFPSKEDLFVEVMRRGIAKISDAVRAAISQSSDPWERLELAAVAHCEAMLAAEGFRVLISPKPPATLSDDSIRKLVAQRKAHEQLITEIINRLDLAPHIDKTIFMFTYLAALNGTAIWYNPAGKLSPSEVARKTIAILKGAAAPASADVGA
ncbi:MAG: TetR/AcrR family transcriptional regulator [Chelatococcus sp.]|uniref:TetR/AcrR family transcriptional regulator n=1 Tax=Chelatococcus sp. TaxID=1953771 RepID=UPI0025C3AD51|nr:TetR/AcrR family transcriptional regulator [Chelatococcus sp.]MBX3539402.1 TetR/AcrR family transcriptional regulator [Chelatococcus sp.]